MQAHFGERSKTNQSLLHWLRVQPAGLRSSEHSGRHVVVCASKETVKEAKPQQARRQTQEYAEKYAFWTAQKLRVRLIIHGC